MIALPFQPFENTDIEEEPAFNGTILMTSITGSILAAKYFVQALIALGKGYGYHFEPGGFIDTYFNKTSTMIGDARLKQAATRKVNTLLVNARSMHGSAQSVYNADSLRKSQSDTVFQNYTLKGESKAKIGNIFWVAERILTGELFDTEGIWLPSRLLIFQAGQITFSCFILFYLFIVVERAADAADEASKNLNPALPSWYIDFVPTGAQVRKALMPAAIISVGVCFCLVLIYIPSSVKTILQFRCGQLRALGDANFQLAREGPDLAYMNTANAIYGTVAAAGLFFFLIGLALFLFVWEFSRGIMLIVIAWGIGLSVTILVKSLLTSLCRKRFFRAFYRVQPGLSNIASLALECWFIGLGGGVLVGRITQFLLASAFWIGRIDEPFLADNISLMGYKFDYVPLNYIKELLVHEAHRHPYLERLSCMYLMRLRYKTFANSDACGAWRQLFVLTLLPWLLKYRVSEEQRCIESLKDQDSEREVEADEDKDAVEATTEEIWGAAFGIGTEGAKTIGEVGLGIVDVGQVGVGVAVDKLRFWKKNTENKK